MKCTLQRCQVVQNAAAALGPNRWCRYRVISGTLTHDPNAAETIGGQATRPQYGDEFGTAILATIGTGGGQFEPPPAAPAQVRQAPLRIALHRRGLLETVQAMANKLGSGPPLSGPRSQQTSDVAPVLGHREYGHGQPRAMRGWPLYQRGCKPVSNRPRRHLIGKPQGPGSPGHLLRKSSDLIAITSRNTSRTPSAHLDDALQVIDLIDRKLADPNGFEPSASAFGAPSFLAEKHQIIKVSAGFSLLNCTDFGVVWRGFER